MTQVYDFSVKEIWRKNYQIFAETFLVRRNRYLRVVPLHSHQLLHLCHRWRNPWLPNSIGGSTARVILQLIVAHLMWCARISMWNIMMSIVIIKPSITIVFTTVIIIIIITRTITAVAAWYHNRSQHHRLTLHADQDRIVETIYERHNVCLVIFHTDRYQFVVSILHIINLYPK